VSERIAVIGGAGFIGTALVRRLLAAGHAVRIADRSPSAAFPDISCIADVRDREALAKACEGSEVLINLAAEHRDDVQPVSLYDEVNVGGARNTCAVAEQIGASRIVFTSSVAVYGFSETETDETSPLRPFNDYGRTKLAAEEVFRAWQAADPARSLVIARPTVVFGEGNRGNVYNLLQQIARGPFVMIGDGTNVKSMAYVENVAAFLEFVLRFGPGLHLFNCVDKPDYDMNHLVTTIRTALGRGSRVGVRLPYGLAMAAGGAFDLLARAIGRPLPVSRIRIEKFCAGTRFAAQRARDAGFVAPVALEEGLRRTLAHEFGAGTTSPSSGR
jgi:nucleoside-diphosphate-sugar epimerase